MPFVYTLNLRHVPRRFRKYLPVFQDNEVSYLIDALGKDAFVKKLELPYNNNGETRTLNVFIILDFQEDFKEALIEKCMTVDWRECG